MKDIEPLYKTQAAYERESELSGSMEDYLEMITRLSPLGEAVRVGALAASLNVSPSSASKMAQILSAKGLVSFSRYSLIYLTKDGRDYGRYLMRRHEAVHSLLCYINHSPEELSETEKIEHFLSRRTVENIEALLAHIRGGANE